MCASTLRVRIRCPSVSPSSVMLEGFSSTITFADFQARVMKALGLTSQGEGDPGPTILAGFPPRPLDLPCDASIGSVISDNESITVRLADPSAGGANPEGGAWGRSRKRSAPASLSTATRASTRAASSPSSAAKGKGRAATGSVGASSTSTSRGRGSSARGGTGGRGTGGIHTLSGPLSSSSTSPGSSSGAGSRAARGSGTAATGHPSGPGRTLSDLPVDSSSPAGAASAIDGGTDGPSRKRSRAGVALTSEGDIAERLLQAVGGKGQGTADRFFRKAMKLAVEKQYDQSRADARVRAAMGGWYTAEASAGQRRLGDGEAVAMKVTFSKGEGSKGHFEETVDRVPRLQVSAVVRMIAGEPESREMLKPHNMAGCSPRIFWSLVEYWGGDVPAALRRAAPDVDWDFLDARDRRPSEKAMANAATEEAQRKHTEEVKAEKDRRREARRKEKEKKRRRMEGLPSESSEDEVEEVSMPGEAPGASSEQGRGSMDPGTVQAAAQMLVEKFVRKSVTDARQQAASAALSRQASSDNVETPPEEEMPSPERDDGEIDVEGLSEIAGESWSKRLIDAGARTVRRLADCDEENLVNKLRATRRRSEGAGSGVGGVVEGASERAEVDEDAVTGWIQEARGIELDEIMSELVEGDEDILEALEEVSVSTPRDVARMGAFPDVLIKAVADTVGSERFVSLAERMTVAKVSVWKTKVDRAIARRPWLDLWVHDG